MRFNRQAEKTVRAVSILVTVLTLIWLAYFFSESLISCLLLVWKHTAEHVDIPVLGSTEDGLLVWGSLGIAILAVCGMRKRLKAVFRGKSGKWYAVLILPLFVVATVTYAANWGASYGILYRSGGNLGLYYDQIFSYVGWGVLSGLSLFAVGLYVSVWIGFIWSRKRRNNIMRRLRFIKCWRSSTGSRSGFGMI